MGWNNWNADGIALRPEMKYTQSGYAVLNFTHASGKKIKTADGNEKKVDCFIPCTIWGKFAEAMSARITDKCKCTISGEIYTEVYEKDGIKRQITKCNVSNITVHGSTAKSNHEDGVPEHAEFVQGPDAGDVW